MNIESEKTANARPHLSVQQFGFLLHDDEGSDKFRIAAEHIETCPECQSQMTTLAADDDWWSDAHTLLSEIAEPRWEPDLSAATMAHGDVPNRSDVVDHTIRDLLESPRHPEMFGRLGRYDIERVIGHGGMGVVVKAHDSELNRPIAIKLLAGHLAHVGAARERFAREGRAAAAVVHEHVVAIYNVESNGKVPYLVMQYVPGRSLQARVDEDGPLGTEEILRIGMQAASGLAAAHRQGLVHRDVKPSNILLEDTVERAVLTDFGLARTFDDASLTHTGIVAGTPHYMSPEQATGEPIDQRSDLFGLGAVLYFMATGHPPFRAANAMAVLHRICHDTHRPVWQRNSDIPDAVSEAIDRLLEKKPGNRFSSADEVQQHLAALLNRHQQQGLSRGRFRFLHNRRLRRRLSFAAAAVAIVAAIGVVIATLDLRTPTQTDQPASQRVDTAGRPQPVAPPAFTREQILAHMKSEQELFNWYNAATNEFDRSSAGCTRFLQESNDPWHHEFAALLQTWMAEYQFTTNPPPKIGNNP